MTSHKHVLVRCTYVAVPTLSVCGCYDLRDEDGVNVNGVAIDHTTSVLEIVNLTLHLREV
jgi:hypothetical protein